MQHTTLGVFCKTKEVDIMAAIDGKWNIAVHTPFGDMKSVLDVKEVDGARLASLIRSGVTPVMAPLTHDGEGNMLNTNADTIAGETAKACAAHFDTTLVYCFEFPGVMRNPEDETSVIPTITAEDFQVLVADGTISGGMIPKIENALQAVNAGVKEVVITKADAIGKNGGTTIK